MLARVFVKLVKTISMSEQFTLQAFEQRTLLAKEKLNVLHQHFTDLHQNYVLSEEKKLKLENQELLAKVASLKEKLEETEKQNDNNTAIQTPPSAPVSAPASQTERATSADRKKASDANITKAKEKPKQAKQPKQKNQEPAPADVSRLDMRVAQIKTVKYHPDADSLYVEEMDTGEETYRTVVTGVVKFIPIEQMQNRMVILMCNLKPAKMRGIVSQAMVMCANCPEAIEIIDPPAGSVPGDRIIFEGYPGKPDAQLNPKKKVWERIQPDLHTNDQCVACYKGVPFTVQGKGVCKVQSLKNCGIK